MQTKTPTPPSNFWTLSNAITLSRVALVPFFLVMFLRGDAVGYAVAYGILALCEASDMLDGAAARARGQTSAVGMLLDPLADTITRFCMFLGLLSAGILPLWMALVFFTRDISIAYLRSFAVCEGVVISARWSGKIKAGVQAVALIVTCGALLFSQQQVYASDMTARLALIASVAMGLGAPLLLALALRLERATLLKLGALSALLLVPPGALWLFPGALVRVQWLVPLSLWAAALVTVYSFFDYLLGFLRPSAPKAIIPPSPGEEAYASGDLLDVALAPRNRSRDS